GGASHRTREAEEQAGRAEEAVRVRGRPRRYHWHGLVQRMDGTEVIYLDTHALIYIAAGEVNRLGAAARKAIDREDVLASAASVLELALLHEIGRLKPTASKLISIVAADIGLRVCDLPFRTIVEHALSEGWTR